MIFATLNEKEGLVKVKNGVELFKSLPEFVEKRQTDSAMYFRPNNKDDIKELINKLEETSGHQLSVCSRLMTLIIS